MEAKGIRLQGELGISRQTIAQGMPACLGCTCMLVCTSLTNIAHETAGAASTRHSLLPLIWETSHASLGRRASRDRETVSTVIASEAKQSISRLAETWIASSLSLLAMTGIARRAGYPASVAYEASLEPRKILQPAA